jgi:glyoxylate reductase
MPKPRLYVTRRLPIDAAPLAGPDIDLVMRQSDGPVEPEELAEAIREADGVVSFLSDAIDGSLLEAAPRLKVIANFAVGYDNIDVQAATERGVWVTNTPDVLTEATADLTWALLLAAARRLAEGERLVRQGEFHGWSPSMLLGLELSGATLGIFGFGRIGRAVARRARGFGMRVLYTSPRRAEPEVEAALWCRRVPKESLIEEADVLSIHAPLNEHTHHAFGTSELLRMKDHALLINTSRGALVDESALVTALERGEIGGAGLDVYEHEPAVHPGLVDRRDVVLLPHLGSATRATRAAMATLAVRNAAAVLRGESPLTPVNTA